MGKKTNKPKAVNPLLLVLIPAIATIIVALIGLLPTYVRPNSEIPTPTITDSTTPANALPPSSTETNTPPSTTNTPRSTQCLWNWEFNTDGDREGWQVNLRVKDLRVENGALRGTWDVFDPSIISPQQLNIDTSIYKTLSIGYQIVSDDIDGQVMWTPNNDNKFSGTMHMLYGIVTDGKWHTITIQLNDDADWMATVNTIRIDPVHDATSGTFAYDYIRICE